VKLEKNPRKTNNKIKKILIRFEKTDDKNRNGQTLEEQQATPAPIVEEVVQPIAPPEVVAQQDIDAKKADIEKRRENELGRTSIADGNGFSYPESSKAKEINAKYDAELAALEGEKPYDASKRKRGGNGPSEYRMVGVSDNDRMTNAELEAFKEWHAKNVPGIPFEMLERLIQVNDNEQAWGVFENGVAKFVRGGLKGTEYHEVFEGIWASFLSESERGAILNEFRNQFNTMIF
jgi:hypothetical protein